jgi:hypothetical protein
MTLSPLDKVIAACRKINLVVRDRFEPERKLFIYRPDGALLRTFDIHGGNKVNADDFANWWRYMGYDK